MNNNEIKLILFDLGGVLVELGESMFPESWLPDGASFCLNDWFSSNIALQFETGLMPTHSFIKNLKQQLSLDASEAAVLTAFREWPVGLIEGTDQLLERLEKDYRIAVLSNSNETHEPRIMRDFALQSRIDDVFFSHRIGYSKPSKEAYLHVLNVLDFKANEVMFFDDNANNVKAAKALGMHAFVVNSPRDVEKYI